MSSFTTSNRFAAFAPPQQKQAPTPVKESNAPTKPVMPKSEKKVEKKPASGADATAGGPSKSSTGSDVGSNSHMEKSVKENHGVVEDVEDAEDAEDVEDAMVNAAASKRLRVESDESAESEEIVVAALPPLLRVVSVA
jgi:hypothetical protein